MKFGGVSLEDVNSNVTNFISVCSLNNGECLSSNIIDKIYKSDNIKVLDTKKLIIDKVSSDCGCDDKKTVPEKELCIINNINENIINRDEKECILYKFFKPIGSHDGNDWLNNTHVDVIQEQLFNIFPNYEYSFIHMIDNKMVLPVNLKCITRIIKCITDIDFTGQIKNNSLKWHGIVYNTDPSHKSGQHWFSILFNFNNNGTEIDPNYIEYFNSSGMDIQDSTFKTYLEDLAFRISYETEKKTILKKVTDIQHQKNSTGNCGIYSLYYIWSRLSGVPMETFNDPNKKITDDTMEYFRKIMFRENE
jgi:hypothetical protein